MSPRVLKLNIKIFKKVRPAKESDSKLEISFAQDIVDDNDEELGVLGIDRQVYNITCNYCKTPRYYKNKCPKIAKKTKKKIQKRQFYYKWMKRNIFMKLRVIAIINTKVLYSNIVY